MSDLLAQLRARESLVIDMLRALYGTWHPNVTAVLDALDDIDRRRLYDMPALDSYVDGRVVLIGDAAHAMAPNLGHGACEALVDADVLVSSLAQGRDLQGALASYDAIRKPVTRRIVRLARLLNRISTAMQSAPIRDAALITLTRSLRQPTNAVEPVSLRGRLVGQAQWD